MNDLLSRTFSKRGVDVEDDRGETEMQSGIDMEQYLAGFYKDVASVKKDIEKVKDLLKKLEEENEETKTALKAQAVKALRDRMDEDVQSVTKTAKGIKDKLEKLDKSNIESRKTKGCEADSPTDRARINITNGLRKNLKDYMEAFNSLRAKMVDEYKDTIERRYFTVTGQKPDEETLENMIETGQSETFLQKAIQDQGRGQVLDTINEIQERHDQVKDIEKNLLELHAIFMDMSVLVEAQGEQLNDIEAQVTRTVSYVRGGVTQLHKARRLQKNTRKWTLCAIILILILILIIVLPIVLTLKK